MDDSLLLQDYVNTRSQRAFSLLVERHIQLVYAAARRQVRDSHLAEDVTQQVFIVLARRANTVRSGAVLPAWLLSATRYTASNLLSGVNRRRTHERRAAQMLRERCDDSVTAVCETSDSLAGQLDEAMSRLNDKDRSAVAMRYLQGKSIREVGTVMGISEEAAQKRVNRAVDKLRSFFMRHGIAMDSAAAVIQGLSRQLANAAPATLAPAVTAAALHSATTASAAGATVGWLGKIFSVAPGKIAAAVCVTAVVAAGTGAVVVQSNRPPVPKAAAPTFAPAPAAGPTVPPPLWVPFVPDNSPAISSAKFSNVALLPVGGPPDYENGIDPSVKRTPESQPAGVLRCLIDNPNPKNGAQRIMTTVVKPYIGKRVRLSAYLKTQDVDNGAGLALIVMGAGGRILANDDMGGRPAQGTTDWKKYDIVADVPTNAEAINVGVVMRGKGTVWADGVELAIVDNKVPFTDDRRWHPWSFNANVYKAELDKNELRNGKPTVCLSSIAKTGPGYWAVYDHNNRNCESWNGKRVRMTGWMKCEDVTAPSGLSMRALGPNFETLARDNTFSTKRPLRGTIGWLKYSVYLDVPENAQGVCSGITMNGGGKIWLDDVHFEVVAR